MGKLVSEDEKLKKKLARFKSLDYEQAINLGITSDDLTGITEVVPGKEYDIKLTFGKRKERKVRGTIIKAIAEKHDVEKQAEKENREYTREISRVKENVTLGDAVEQTIDYLLNQFETSGTIDVNTIYGYLDAIERHVYDYFPKATKLKKIHAEDIKAFLGYMFKKTRKDGTELLSVSSISEVWTALNWVIKYSSEIANPKLMPYNVADSIKFNRLIPKSHKKKEIKKVKSHSLEELIKLICSVEQSANIRLKAMIKIIGDVGCRREECCGLRLSDINFVTGAVKYQTAITASISMRHNQKYCGTREKELKSKYSYRMNFLTEDTLNTIREYITFKKALGLSVEQDDFLFTRWDSNQVLSPISFSDEYSDFRKKYGFLDFPLHSIRHTLSNLLQEAGLSQKDVAQHLGNTPRTIAESYSDMKLNTEDRIRNYISSLLKDNCNKVFKVDTVVSILNDNVIVANDELLEMLDFITGSNVSLDNYASAIEVAKEVVLSQYPFLDTFCTGDQTALNLKLKKYKELNSSELILSQNKTYKKPILII